MSFEDYAVEAVIAILVMLSIGFVGYCCYGILAEDAGDSVIMYDGRRSYSCVVSKVDKTPHDCKPINDAK